MSIDAISWASKLKLPPRDKFVLVALCDHYNRDEQAAWMKQETLAEWTGYSRATVNAALEALEKEHKVIVSETRRYADGRNAAKVYRINSRVKSVDSGLGSRVNALDPVRVNAVNSVRVNRFDSKNQELRTVNSEPSSPPTPPTPNPPTEPKIDDRLEDLQNLDPLQTLARRDSDAAKALARVAADARWKFGQKTEIAEALLTDRDNALRALDATFARLGNLNSPLAYFRKVLAAPEVTATPTTSPTSPPPRTDRAALIDAAERGDLDAINNLTN